MQKRKSIKKCLQRFISPADLFGQPVTLSFKNSEQFSTHLGQFTSTVILIITTASFVSLTLDMFNHTNPNIVTKIQSNLNPENLYLDSDSFSFAIGFSDYMGLPIRNTAEKVFYTMNFQVCHQAINMQADGTAKAQQDCTSIDMVPCLDTKINTKLLQFSNDKLGFAMCLNQTTQLKEKSKMYLNGLSSSEKFGYLQINAEYCNPKKQSSVHFFLPLDCAPPAEIQDSMGAGFFSLGFTDQILDQTQAGNPYNYVTRTLTSGYSNHSQTDVRYTLRHSQLNSQDNFYYYFPQSETYHAATLVDTMEAVFPRSDHILVINFFLDDKLEFYYRTYNTFFDILGNIGGIYQFLVVLASFLIMPITKLSQNLSLMNSIFTFDDSNHPNADINKSRPRKLGSHAANAAREDWNNQNMNSIDSPKREFTQLSPHYSYRQRSTSIKNIIRQKDKGLYLSSYELILSFCGGKKKQTLDQALTKLEAQLDIGTILTKLLEIEKLKYFLLSDDQRQLFDLIPKPKIHAQQVVRSNSVVTPQRQESMIEYFPWEGQIQRKVERSLESYRLLKISNKREDVRLIEMMDLDIKDMFEEWLAQLSQQDKGAIEALENFQLGSSVRRLSAMEIHHD